jgi:hypothetical protein
MFFLLFFSAMARYVLICVCALAASAFADDAGYAAPAASYGAPAAAAPAYNAPAASYGAPAAPSYAAPSYSAPAAGYDAPNDNYGAPSYNEPATGYGPVADPGNNIFSLDRIIELIPFFLAVLAAIIIAQIIAPLIALLFNAKVGLLAPLGNAKIGLINAVLSPFGLSLCTLNPLAIATGRGFPEEYGINPEIVDFVTKGIAKAYEGKYIYIL